jgi:hypothetical protein
MNTRLFYCEKEGNFYWIKETKSQLKIDWVIKRNCDSEKTLLDQNVRWSNLKVSTMGKNRNHCLKEFEKDYILIYPYQNGQPFSLKLATKDEIQNKMMSEIDNDLCLLLYKITAYTYRRAVTLSEIYQKMEDTKHSVYEIKRSFDKFIDWGVLKFVPNPYPSAFCDICGDEVMLEPSDWGYSGFHICKKIDKTIDEIDEYEVTEKISCLIDNNKGHKSE